MRKKLTVLFAPINYVGPVLSSIGMAEVLRDGGHRPVFAISQAWKQKVSSVGFEIELMDDELTDDDDGGGGGQVADSAAANVEELRDLLDNISPMDKYVQTFAIMFDDLIRDIDKEEPALRTIIERVRPDIIITDHILDVPAIIQSGVPYILSYSSNPLSLDMGLEDPRLPPSLLGLSVNSDKSEWEQLRTDLKAARRPGWLKYSDWLQSKGLPPTGECQLFSPSPYATIYMFPKELDYTDQRPLPDTFHGFDNFKRSENEDKFEVPKQLSQRSGKLVYLSLGSMGSGNVDLMKRLISMLAKSEHRFIVSKGVYHDKYELADNMWGERSVPQVKVLSIVDLFITHGGNNSVTECMYFGKPMIVFPMFYDQYDNAQRVEDKGYGIRLNPYECSEQQLLQSIDKLLNDKQLAEKLQKLSQRIQNERNIENLVKLVENIANK
ncbi:NDP-glycosyltransferase YjiC-like [Oppia nitens]|uniref:NDP-glycosyltransferase YjiC-like n=1 Tax=Oppia nitens TaxID=1686743 RepID=UPI0023DAB237|nr:NDP-glycosyltransferase YjiC-like [Oppia nitens]